MILNCWSSSINQLFSFLATVPLPEGQECQSRPLKNLVSYLKQKDAAGVISLSNKTTEQSGVLYAFPPCNFSLDLLRRVSGDLSDERMVAGITMAGTINRSYHADDGHLSVRGPVLLMSGSNDSGHAVSESFETLSGIQRSLLDIEGACHGSFNVGLCDTLDVDRGYHIVQTYALAFGRQHVLNDDDSTVVGILDGSIPVDEAASISLGN